MGALSGSSGAGRTSVGRFVPPSCDMLRGHLAMSRPWMVWYVGARYTARFGVCVSPSPGLAMSRRQGRLAVSTASCCRPALFFFFFLFSFFSPLLCCDLET